jgi:hypothetical protein
MRRDGRAAPTLSLPLAGGGKRFVRPARYWREGWDERDCEKRLSFCGEGWGRCRSLVRTRRDTLAAPPPSPSPSRGEGSARSPRFRLQDTASYKRLPSPQRGEGMGVGDRRACRPVPRNDGGRGGGGGIPGHAVDAACAPMTLLRLWLDAALRAGVAPPPSPSPSRREGSARPPGVRLTGGHSGHRQLQAAPLPPRGEGMGVGGSWSLPSGSAR